MYSMVEEVIRSFTLENSNTLLQVKSPALITRQIMLCQSYIFIYYTILLLLLLLMR